MLKYFKYSALLVILLITSCGKDSVDVTSPSMDEIAFTPIPIEDIICGNTEPEVFILNGGDELSFDALFTDNEALSQYKIDIHNNFDCHGHGGGSAPSIAVPNVTNQTIDWSVLDIQNISGTSSQVFRALQVPQNVTAGNYHFHLQVIDDSGNDNPFANFYSLKITNPLDNTPPQIGTQEPASTSFTIKKGEQINFKGQVTDDRSLSDGGNGILYLAYTDLSSGNTFATDKVYAFDDNIDVSFDFDFEYEIPQTLVAGNYRFSLGATDGVRNVAPFVFFEVEVKN